MTSTPVRSLGSDRPTSDPYRLLGISGSLRRESFSTAVLKAVSAAAAPAAQFDFTDIGALPHFNQDLYVEPLPKAVEHFRQQILEAEGLVICSPEYNHGVPGVLKNALDWASRPHNLSPLKGKLVLIVTSSPAFTGGVRAQYQIREALVSALAQPVSTPEIVVGSVGAKVVDGRFQDAAATAFALQGLAAMFDQLAAAFERRRSLAKVDQV